jgi:hypothetical protein
MGLLAIPSLVLPPLALIAQALLQGPALPAAPTPDSAAVRKGARRAQERFETYRVHRLPWAPGRNGQCDVQIGRLCYWYDDDPELPPEPREIGVARDTLLATLARAAEALPGDGWIAGQRVRYLTQGGRVRDAVDAAAACRSAEPGWCAALAGLALHVAGEFAAADSAFAVALAALPERRRCEWLDLAVLLQGELRDRYRRTGCAERPALNERLWWLARPFYVIGGNDLRTEHYARLTMARVLEKTRVPHGMPWGDDMEELLVRYGWETSWARDRSSTLSTGGSGTPVVAGYEPRPSYYFLPTARALAAPADARPDDWELRDPRASTRYSPAYGRPVARLDAQTALFRRGDSTLAVATYDLSRDTLFAGGVSEAALVLARDEHSEVIIGRAPSTGVRGVLTATAPWRPALVGVEVLSRQAGRAARTRFGTGPRPDSGARIALSDLLLLDATAAPPTTLAEALPHVRASTRARVGERVGLFWEVYGLTDRAQNVSVSLTTGRARTGWGRRSLEALRLARRPQPVRLRWESRADADRQIATGALTLGLADLGPGTHRIEVRVRTAEGDSASTSRVITIAR